MINKTSSLLREHKTAIMVVMFFAAIYSLQSLVNHYLFRTYAWDLGIINNSVYDYRHLRWNNCMIMQPEFTNLLSDHFTLYPVLISPLSWIFGSYTMLVFQIVVILFGGIGIYLLALSYGMKRSSAVYSMVFFFSVWGIYSALSFDYHDNVIGAMILPWLTLYLKRGAYVKFFICLILAVISKENIALWYAAICGGFALRYMNDSSRRKVSAAGLVISLLFFIVVVKYIMPELSNGGKGYRHFEYAVLGDQPSDVPHTIFARPWVIFKAYFINLQRYSFANNIKWELYYVFLLSGGILLFLRPEYLLMLLPVISQKVLNNDFTKWGLNQHYSIEFVPVLVIGVLDVLHTRISKHQDKIIRIVTLITITVTAVKLDSRTSKWYVPEQNNIVRPSHWKRDFDAYKVHQILKNIPDSAKVSATTVLVPHLAFRDYIYQYPVVEDASLIVLLKKGTHYPLDDQQFTLEVNRLKDNDGWKTDFEDSDIIIFKKR